MSNLTIYKNYKTPGSLGGSPIVSKNVTENKYSIPFATTIIIVIIKILILLQLLLLLLLFILAILIIKTIYKYSYFIHATSATVIPSLSNDLHKAKPLTFHTKKKYVPCSSLAFLQYFINKVPNFFTGVTI